MLQPLDSWLRARSNHRYSAMNSLKWALLFAALIAVSLGGVVHRHKADDSSSDSDSDSSSEEHSSRKKAHIVRRAADDGSNSDSNSNSEEHFSAKKAPVVRRAAAEDDSSSEDHPQPSFLDGLDAATKDKFKAIFRDHSLKGDAKDAALLKLATSVLKPDKLAEFKTHQAEWKQKRAQWKADYDAKYAKLSPNAKKAADQIKGLWGTGLDKATRKAKKEEILKTLTDAERKEIENLFPKRGGGHRSRRDAEDDESNPAEHKTPSFMEGLDAATKDKFKAIFHDHSLKGDAKDAALLNLATSVLKPDKLAEFKSHQAEWKQKRAQWKADYDAKYAKLSPNAKKAADQIKGVWESDGMDRTAKKAKKEEILKTLTDAERKEIENLFPKRGGKPSSR